MSKLYPTFNILTVHQYTTKWELHVFVGKLSYFLTPFTISYLTYFFARWPDHMSESKTPLAKYYIHHCLLHPAFQPNTLKTTHCCVTCTCSFVFDFLQDSVSNRYNIFLLKTYYLSISPGFHMYIMTARSIKVDILHEPLGIHAYRQS